MQTLEKIPAQSEDAPELDQVIERLGLVSYDLAPKTLEQYGLYKLPRGYAVMGGAARAVAQGELFDEDAIIRDIDLVAISEMNPDMNHARELEARYMPDDSKHGARIKPVALEDYMGSRDLTLNELLIIDGKIIATEQGLADLRNKIIRPTEHELAFADGVGPKITIKGLLFQAVFEEQYGHAEIKDFWGKWSTNTSFYEALALNKAFQYGPGVTKRYMKILVDQGFVRPEQQYDPVRYGASLLPHVRDFTFRGSLEASEIHADEFDDGLFDDLPLPLDENHEHALGLWERVSAKYHNLGDEALKDYMR